MARRHPRTMGLTTEDLDSPDAVEDADDRQSALQIACRRKPEILKRLKPEPALDDLRELIAAVASLVTTPETWRTSRRHGADINDKADGGAAGGVGEPDRGASARIGPADGDP